MAIFIANVGVIEPFNVETIVNVDLLIHVITGHYEVVLSRFQKFIIFLDFWIEPLNNKDTESNLKDLQQEIALVNITACYRIREICAY